MNARKVVTDTIIILNFSYCQKIVLLKLPKVSIERKTKTNGTGLFKNQKNRGLKVSGSTGKNSPGKEHADRLYKLL